MKMGHGQGAGNRSRDITLTQAGHQQGQGPPGYEPSQHGELAEVPHNEYPTDGMTMFCRTGPPSDLSSNGQVRPSSSDSRSEYSVPTSYSSLDPSSGKTSPIKLNHGAAAPAMSPDKSVQKKRSGFFSNSPFRRKSKHEKDVQNTPTGNAGNRNTWAPSSRNGGSQQSSPTKSGFKGPTMFANDRQSGSPEPVDPRANFQLNVGNNVFDVASPDQRGNKNIRTPTAAQDEMDPIAQALAELKGVGKQASVRMSVDRYTGIATPAPGGAPPPLSNPAINGAHRGTPPPSYDSTPVKRLDAPQPAFTSAAMRQATSKYTGQTQDMFGANSRPGTRDGHNVPRATSPAPPRATSPRPGMGMYPGNQHRSVSPNPFNPNGRPRGQTQSASNSPTKRGSDQGYQPQQYSRHTSPNDIRRAASPQPQFARQERPQSSGGMEMQLAHNGMDKYDGGSHHGQGRPQQQARPMSYYGGGGGGGPPPSDMGGSQNGRNRSKSVADGGGQYTRDGRPIIHFGKLPHIPPH
jgi:hypothetical protein